MCRENRRKDDHFACLSYGPVTSDRTDAHPRIDDPERIFGLTVDEFLHFLGCPKPANDAD